VPAYSREQEREADHWGMIYMSKAGFDPRAAIRVWEKAAQTDSIPFDVYASHPSHAERAANLTALLPEADSYYKRVLAGEDFAAAAGPAWGRAGAGEDDDFGRAVTGRLPQEALQGSRFQPDTVDTTNYFIDHASGRVTVVVANTTGLEIEEFTLNIAFYDKDGHIISTASHKHKKDLEGGGQVQLTFRMPEGTRDVRFRAAGIEWD